MIEVSVVMGSESDWNTMKETCRILEKFEIVYEKDIVSAHRSPDKLFEFAKSARSRGIQVIIAGAGGAAHLPGMIASISTLPVLGVPVQSNALNGVDSLYSIVQMPKGVPVGTLAIGVSGAVNAAILAIEILSLKKENLAAKLEKYKVELRDEALSKVKNLTLE